MITPAITHPHAHVYLGDCLDVLSQMPENSVGAIVTDPPYGLSKEPDMTEVLRHWLAGDDYIHKGSGFMGKTWDSFVPGPSVWRECLRVLKPGGHMLCFAGTRTMGLMETSIRLAGFQTRDSIAWLHSQGFPKGANLKPAFEPIIVARKTPVGSVKANVEEWGVGDLNIDVCRVEVNGERFGSGAKGSSGFVEGYERGAGFATSTKGRWPTNVVLDGQMADALDEQSGTLKSGKLETHHTRNPKDAGILGAYSSVEGERGYGDSGGASRFYPTFRDGEASAQRRYTEEGGTSFAPLPGARREAVENRSEHFPVFRYQAKAPTRERPSYTDESGKKIAHSTVKPLELMKWLCRLVTPPSGLVLDPFTGSGTTLEAAVSEGFAVIGVEREAEYLPLIQQRLDRINPSA